ncbi:MAG: AraC family transcriptional regulator [Lachnospiraceae bacterium]|nr:AraC family transcriptional regulator [Lachnospiraceae bacterium]
MQTKKLPEPFLANMGFHPCACKETLNLEGICYEPPEELGEGYYWYYERESLFTIAVLDLRLKQDYVLEYQQQDFISINYYDTISAEELSPYKRLSASCIRGHVSESQLFRARYHKNVPVHGMELMLMPGYYHDYLEQKYPGEFPDPKEAFRSVDGISDFPELVLLMRQIQTFQGTGIAAHLFYESKVAEAISLIIEKTKAAKGFVPSGELTKDDIVNLDAVKCYIEDHFAFEIRTEQLMRIACMGQTKLRYLFKKRYGYTITEFIQNKRIAHAEYMLIGTDFTISQIAEAVGYHHAGRFASLFHRNTGLFPDEYRQVMKSGPKL